MYGVCYGSYCFFLLLSLFLAFLFLVTAFIARKYIYFKFSSLNKASENLNGYNSLDCNAILQHSTRTYGVEERFFFHGVRGYRI